MTFRKTLTLKRPAKQYEGKGPDMRPSACRMSQTAATMSVPVPKSKPWRSEAYRRAVAALPCAHCGKVGRSQAAHADTLGGKGMGIKVCDRLTYPACCADGRTHSEGCHAMLASGLFKRWQRQILEETYVAKTQAALAHLLPPEEKTE